MKLPKLNLKPASDQQKHRLARWLEEWELFRHIDEGARNIEADIPFPSGKRSIVGSGKNSEVIAGQIRLFFPGLLPGTSRPLYFAVLDVDERGSCLLAPFGRFAEPCLPDEYLTGRKVSCLRVLCFWNRLYLPVNIVGNSWFADMLSPAERWSILSVLEHITAGFPLAKHLASLLGPPCWHPADPRRDYIAEESDLIQTLQRFSQRETIQYPEHKPSQRKAAEDHDEYE